MRHDELWQHIHTERRALAERLSGLSGADWERPSLCPGWSVLDVAAHVISNPQLRGRHVLAMAARNLGRGYNTMIFREVKRWSRDQTPARIVADFETYAGSTRHVPLTTSVEPLLDVIVHSQDILRPLGISYAAAPEAIAVAADRARLHASYMGWGRAKRFTLVATDHEWTRGKGPVVEGPISELLMLSTGREPDWSLLRPSPEARQLNVAGTSRRGR
jgi:uncharacterized protein (TIGR03083 family)